MKNIAGYPMRFGVFMFLIAPPLAKLAAKASHLIFGKPTKSVLDEGKEDKKAEGQPQAGAPMTDANLAQLQALATQQTVAPATGNNTNLLNNYQTGNQPGAAPQMQAQTPAPAAPAQPKAPVRTYMPSAEGVKIQPTAGQNAGQPQGADKAAFAFNRADRAEQEALKFLAGK